MISWYKKKRYHIGIEAYNDDAKENLIYVYIDESRFAATESGVV